MISPYRFSLILLGAVLFLGSPVVAQTSQTPASLSGKTDKKGWPLPRWWVKYRKRFGKRVQKCKFLGKKWPKSGDKCRPLRTGRDFFCLLGDAFCCDGVCEPAYRCDCVAGAFQCAYTNINNPCSPKTPSPVVSECPSQKPLQDSACTIGDTKRCAYPQGANADCQTVEDVCQCVNGAFVCAINYIGLSTCLPQTAPNVPEYACPSSLVAQGDACALEAYQVCGYENQCCAGPNDGSGVTKICFPDDICTCQKGRFECTNVLNQSVTAGCHQVKPDFTAFPSSSPRK